MYALYAQINDDALRLALTPTFDALINSIQGNNDNADTDASCFLEGVTQGLKEVIDHPRHELSYLSNHMPSWQREYEWFQSSMLRAGCGGQLSGDPDVDSLYTGKNVAKIVSALLTYELLSTGKANTSSRIDYPYPNKVEVDSPSASHTTIDLSDLLIQADSYLYSGDRNKFTAIIQALQNRTALGYFLAQGKDPSMTPPPHCLQALLEHSKQRS